MFTPGGGVPQATSCHWNRGQKGGCTKQTVPVPRIQKLGFYGNPPVTCISHKRLVSTKHFLGTRPGSCRDPGVVLVLGARGLVGETEVGQTPQS